ncbi:MAG: tetratricopeptide repeat protein [Clostridiaceae bacterium]|nr:tetratricopeptide repeat protein [Clostridiaceae bacterium]
MKDYFEVLDIDDSAGEQAIRNAYEAMLEKYPADQYPEKNREIEEAFKALCDETIQSACIHFHRMEAASKKAYKDAHDAISEGHYDKAARILVKVYKKEKYSAHLCYLLGIAYMNLGEYSKAMKVLEPVRHEYPNDMELVLIYIKSCLGAKRYEIGLDLAEDYYTYDRDNFALVQLLAEGYIMIECYDDATKTLKEAFENPVFSDKRFYMGARMSHSLFLENKFKESLDMLDRLVEFPAEPDEINDSLEICIRMLNYFIADQKFVEADRCAGVLRKLCPDREDIAGIKEGVENILKLEPELVKFEKDEFIPELLKVYTRNDAFPRSTSMMPAEQQKAYAVLLEHYILSDYSEYLMALRYMKNNFPALYELKEDFFDRLQETRERKKLYNKNRALFYQYQGVLKDMMDEWDEQDGFYDDDDDDNDDEE